MAELIATDKLIKEAKKEGVDFGKGDPYNRLRYYTKLGWLPHMERQKDKSGDVVGHYPNWVIERLKLIQELKDQGLSNDEISQKIKTHDVKRNIFQILNIFSSPQRRIRLITYISFIILVIILVAEMGILPFSQSKQALINNSSKTRELPNQILDSGSALFPRNERTVYVRTNSVTPTSKINVTFEGNYTPASNYWVSNIVPYEGFFLELDSPINTSTTFNWWVTN